MKKRTGRGFPSRAFLAAISVVCVGLGMSAVHGFLTLSRLRDEVLRGRGHDIAAAIDAQTRGEGRRNNLAVWQQVLEESWRTHRDSVAFLALLDGSGRVLTSVGEDSSDILTAPAGPTVLRGFTLYLFDMLTPAPQHPPPGSRLSIDSWRIRIGLYTRPAAFIMQQAYVHLLMAGVAILTLLGLTIYFLRTLNRFLELKAREESERHLTTLGRMAATLAHEIRNPLGAMKGLTQVVQEELPQDHTSQALMQTVISEAERLEQLVSDLLTFARPREPHISQLDLKQLLADVEAMLQPKVAEAGITLSVIADADFPRIRSDENGLRQVLLNVLLNAIDATPRGGAITVRAKHPEGSREMIIEVDDSGTGLGERDPEELFEPFTTTKVKGTGLGLAISRQIVESMGGKITLANRPEGGARCTIRLPISL